MKISPEIDLARSLRHLFGNKVDFGAQVDQESARQSDTTSAILTRFFGGGNSERREMMILADEVGLGKTYVALAVAVSILDAIRNGQAPVGLPRNRPVVLVLTPNNDALFNKWKREAEAFQEVCARTDDGLDWLQICCPIENSNKSGNLVDLSAQMKDATHSNPMLLIAKQGVMGAALHDKELWRKRGLATLFARFSARTETRRKWCRKGRVFDVGTDQLRGLLDLRKSGEYWEDSPVSEEAFSKVIQNDSKVSDRAKAALNGSDVGTLTQILDELTRHALVTTLPSLPLVIIDEIHGFKNKGVKSRLHFETLLEGKICRLLGLSATPFQLRHDELLSLLELHRTIKLTAERSDALEEAESGLGNAMKEARNSGEIFRTKWKRLRPVDQTAVSDSWSAVTSKEGSEQRLLADQLRPPRISHAMVAALDLKQRNTELQRQLSPFVIRHQHSRGYRGYFVGNQATLTGGRGAVAFNWTPGMDVRGKDELAQYLMMRAVSLAKDEPGMSGLGAELTGSYRHLIETAAVWKKLARSSAPLLRDYRNVLEKIIGEKTPDHDPDAEHLKIQATVQRALEFFKLGQKSLVFCVYTKTAEAVRDQLRVAIDNYLSEIRAEVFGSATAFENFGKRFFNRREALFSLIQDHPLLGEPEKGRVGVPPQVALTIDHLRQIGELMVARKEYAESDKPDRRLLLAATEHVAVRWWRTNPDGIHWLREVLENCPELEEKMVDLAWLTAREPLSRSERAGKARQLPDPEAPNQVIDPLEAEEADGNVQTDQDKDSSEGAADAWLQHLRADAIGEVIAPYFQPGLIAASGRLKPLLADHHRLLLAKFDLETRAVAGQVFRRILMAEEFLLRYLADVEKDKAERWADFLAERYIIPLKGHLESLRDRVHAYLETLVRAKNIPALLDGYRVGAGNRNVAQLVKGDTQNRDRYFLGFNTPYRPEILVSTSVGQEGIDLHRECRHVIHHDLCWNPATIEQRTGRVDRIGSKVERERMGAQEEHRPALEIAVPYLAATYDERMFEELYRRAQLFEVTLGGEMQVENRIDQEDLMAEHRRREKLGIGNDDEDFGDETEQTGVVDLPTGMIETLRVDLAVWKPLRP